MKSDKISLYPILAGRRPTILFAIASLALCHSSTAAASLDSLSTPFSSLCQAKSETKQGKKQELLKKLHKILNGINRSIKSIVSPERIEARLRGRTLSYRQIPVSKTAASDPTMVKKGPVVEASDRGGRLLGDQEREALAKGVVMTVDGMPVQEKDIEDLANYYGSYLPGSKDEHKTKAISEIIRVRAAEARYKKNLDKARKKIDAIYEKLTVKKADFAELAKQESEGPSGANGGNLGLFPREGMVGTFARWAFTLGVGKISPVFASPFGYHILKVTGRQKGAVPAEDQVKASHILVMFTRNSEELQSVMRDATNGKSDVGVISKEWKALLPANYR